jgi:hypothetical protein
MGNTMRPEHRLHFGWFGWSLAGMDGRAKADVRLRASFFILTSLFGFMVRCFVLILAST